MARLSVLKSKIDEHLANNGMSYLEHARFSGSLSVQFAKLAATSAIHAILPCYFETHSSDCVKDLYWKFASKR